MPEFRFEIRLSRGERKHQTRERLLDAAARVFAQRGFAAATLDEVAEAAGFTKGAVYSNFASKSDLFAALMEQRFRREAVSELARLRALTLEEILSEAEIAAGADTGSCAQLSAEEREWMALSCQFWLHALHDEPARKALAREYERVWQANVDVLAEKYAEAGLEPPIPPREYAILAEAIGIGIYTQHMIDPQAVPLGIATRGLMRLLGRPVAPAATGALEAPGLPAATGALEAPAAPAAPDRPVAPKPSAEERPAGSQPRTGV